MGFGAIDLLDALGRSGRPGGEVAARLDLLRSTGPGYALRRRRENAEWAKLAGDGRRPGYHRMWTEAARELGGEVTDLSHGFLEIRLGRAVTRVWNHRVMLDDVVTAGLAVDKSLVHERLAAAGLPTPAHLEFDAGDLEPALRFLERHGRCVVKPVTGAGGDVTTTAIRSPADLRRARLRARRYSRRLLIEREVAGDNYRFLFLDGELLDALRRLRPGVTGDGYATIAELIEAENRRRFEAAGGEQPWLLSVDLDMVLALREAGLKLSSVLAPGAHVALKGVINENAPEENESVRDAIGPELLAEATAAAATVGVRLAGVDVITPDPRRSLHDCGGVILEVNAAPGLHYHYEVRDPARAVPVATLVLRRLLSEPAAAALAAEAPAAAAPAPPAPAPPAPEPPRRRVRARLPVAAAVLLALVSALATSLYVQGALRGQYRETAERTTLALARSHSTTLQAAERRSPAALQRAIVSLKRSEPNLYKVSLLAREPALPRPGGIGSVAHPDARVFATGRFMYEDERVDGVPVRELVFPLGDRARPTAAIELYYDMSSMESALERHRNVAFALGLALALALAGAVWLLLRPAAARAAVARLRNS